MSGWIDAVYKALLYYDIPILREMGIIGIDYYRDRCTATFFLADCKISKTEFSIFKNSGSNPVSGTQYYTLAVDSKTAINIMVDVPRKIITDANPDAIKAIADHFEAQEKLSECPECGETAPHQHESTEIED